MKKLILLLLLSCSTILSFAKGNPDKLPANGTPYKLPEDKFTDFIPISPVEFDGDISTYDENGQITTTIQKLWQCEQTDALRHFINDIKSNTTITIIDKDGNINYLINTFSAKNNTYTINADWLQCRTVDVFDATKKIGEILIGVGIRITASITTKERNLNLSQILSAGAGINFKKTKGKINIDVIGLESKEITALTPVLNELTTTSIQEAVKTMATIRSKIYDPETKVYPKIVAVRKLNPKDDTTQKKILEQYKTNVIAGTNLLAPGSHE